MDRQNKQSGSPCSLSRSDMHISPCNILCVSANIYDACSASYVI